MPTPTLSGARNPSGPPSIPANGSRQALVDLDLFAARGDTARAVAQGPVLICLLPRRHTCFPVQRPQLLSGV